MSDQPWKDQPTPLTDAQPTIAQYEPKPVTRFVAVDFARALERRMRAAEALLARYTLAIDSRDINKHLAAAQAMDVGVEFPYATEDRKNSREFAKVVKESKNE